ncbi:hypothetical protein TNCV_1656601 [Trichonephila clavipes]|nr:hypothetical protein TNCV_1656601 [Trichonephila clavipes]
MHAHKTLTPHALADMFENIGCFMDRYRSVGCWCYRIHFRIDSRVVHLGSERSMFHQVLMHPSKRWRIRLPSRSPHNSTATRPFPFARPYMKWISVNSALI